MPLRIAAMFLCSALGAWYAGALLVSGWAGLGLWALLLVSMSATSKREEQAAATLNEATECLRRDAALRGYSLVEVADAPLHTLLRRTGDYSTALTLVTADPRPTWVDELCGGRIEVLAGG